MAQYMDDGTYSTLAFLECIQHVLDKDVVKYVVVQHYTIEVVSVSISTNISIDGSVFKRTACYKTMGRSLSFFARFEPCCASVL